MTTDRQDGIRLFSAPASRIRHAASTIRGHLLKLMGIKIDPPWYIGQIHVRRGKSIIIGSNCVFHDNCYLWPTDDSKVLPALQIGNNNVFGRNVAIEAHAHISIGSNNMFGPGSYIIDSDHDISEIGIQSLQRIKCSPVLIGSNCWIGAKAIVLKGVSLEDGCVVAAGAVVTRSFSQNSIVGGVPARLIGMRVPNNQAAVESTQI